MKPFITKNKKRMLIYSIIATISIILICATLTVVSFVMTMCIPGININGTLYYQLGDTHRFEVRGDPALFFFWSYRSNYANQMFLSLFDFQDDSKQLAEFYIKARNGDIIFHYKDGDTLVCANPEDYPEDFDDIRIEVKAKGAVVNLGHNVYDTLWDNVYDNTNTDKTKKPRSRAKIKISSDGENWYPFPTPVKDLPKIFGPMEMWAPSDIQGGWY